MRALRDAAQRYAREVRLRKTVLGIAVLPSDGQAKIIAELLVVPRNPFRIVVRRNAIVMYPKGARAAFDISAACLKL
jgi:hypothetical protein